MNIGYNINDLKVYKKTENLLYEFYPKLINYPKAEKYALCQQIKSEFYEVLKYISLGNSVKSKRRTYLQEADGHLQILKVLMKLSRNQKYISLNHFKSVDLKLTEINKLLSGYIKSKK